jgi:hypothetical protein
MTTIPVKRYRKQNTVDPVAALTFMLVIGALLLISARAGFFYPAIARSPGIQSGVNSALAGFEVSFAGDLQYWDANCSHGWASDSTCDGIARKAQSCEISAASAYCSEYKAYLQQILDQ